MVVATAISTRNFRSHRAGRREKRVSVAETTLASLSIIDLRVGGGRGLV